MQRRSWQVMLLLLLTGSMTGYAQSNCFTYENTGETIINGLTDIGQAATSLTVPKEVTAIRSGAFCYSSPSVSTLVIEAGGNPAFEPSLFTERTNPLGEIQILGSSMSVTNITALFTSLGAQGALSTVYIEGYSGEWSDIGVTDVLTVGVDVVLPAEKVTTQVFGNAKVKGRFTITKEIITFCGSATFQDIDDGSNQLFYVANNKAEDGRLHIQRVRYVVADEGVLIHRLDNSEGYADLPRYSGAITKAEQDLYASNKLKGVTTATTIGKTDGNYTNYILKDGAFHPTSGGTVKANKAYLQLPTSAAREMLTIDFDDETTGVKGVSEVKEVSEVNDDSWYDLSGRKIAQPTKGLYIKNGKKYVIR